MANNSKDKKEFRKTSKTKSAKRSNTRRKTDNFKDVIAKEVGSDNFQRPGKPNTFNDPDWYIYDDVMFDGVISMPTLEFKGLKTKWATTRPNIASEDEGYLGVPTVSVMYMNPSAGYRGSYWAESPVNIMSRKMYAELSASNAKTSQYAPQDIATLILALGQVIAITNHIKRMYGIFNYYNFYNRTIPKALFGAIGINSDTNYANQISNMAAIRARLNKVIARINSIHFPSNINYFRKCEYIYSNLFVDRDDEMPTYLAMMPHSTWIIDEGVSEEGTILKTVDMNTAYKTSQNPVMGALNTLEGMVEAVLTSATFNYIFADLINLANRNVISADWISIDMVPIDYTVEPIYSEQFNWQFMNATLLGIPKTGTVGLEDTPDNDVYPSVTDNCIRYAPTFNSDYVSDILRMGKPNPVRIPNVDIADRDFVDLLAYYNIPYVMWDASSVSASEAKVNGLSDYYAVSLATFTGNNALASQADVFYSNGPSYSTSTEIPARISKFSKVLNIVHAPLITMPEPEGQIDKTHIMSKLGTFVIPNSTALTNLRDEVFFGLFKIK